MKAKTTIKQGNKIKLKKVVEDEIDYAVQGSAILLVGALSNYIFETNYILGLFHGITGSVATGLFLLYYLSRETTYEVIK